MDEDGRAGRPTGRAGRESHVGEDSAERTGGRSAVWPAAGAVVAWVLATGTLLATVLASGRAEVRSQLGGGDAPGIGAQLLGMALGLVLALGVLLLALASARAERAGGRRVLGAAAIGLGGSAAVLTAVTGAQYSMLVAVAEAAPTPAPTVPGQGMVGLAVVLLVVGCVAAAVLALRPRHAAGRVHGARGARGADGGVGSAGADPTPRGRRGGSGRASG
ncbi:hypothetical protein [Cellulomonas bogoriensis]